MKNIESIADISAERSQEYYSALADKLDKMQAEKNQRRGIDCIRTLIHFLRSRRIEEAKAVCFNESDKIRSYEDIGNILRFELFKKGEENPWTLLEKMKEELKKS